MRNDTAATGIVVNVKACSNTRCIYWMQGTGSTISHVAFPLLYHHMETRFSNKAVV